MYLEGPTADAVFSRATLRPVAAAGELPVASAEHLAMMKGLAMKHFPLRALYEGDDVRVLLDAPGVNHEEVREYYRELGLLELYDAIDKVRRST